MTSIDEAIAHAREIAEEQRKDNENCKYKAEYGCKGCADYYSKPCIECAEEHEQIADWLEELKTYRECNVCEYNKAIDDFKSRLEERILAGKMIDEKFAYIDNCDIDEISEQLKAGDNNGT